MYHICLYFTFAGHFHWCYWPREWRQFWRFNCWKS